MASPDQKQETYTNVKKLLNALSGLKVADLSRRDQLSPEINFQDAVPDLEQMLDLVKQINQRDLTRLPLSELNKIQAAGDLINAYVDKINDFQLNINQPLDTCNAIINEIKNGYDKVMENLLMSLSFTASQATDFAKLEREAKGFYSTMQEEASTFKKLLQDHKDEADDALYAIKEQAAEAGVATNGKIFLDDSLIHARIAKKWMTATIWVSVLTLLVAILFVGSSYFWSPTSTAASIQYAISKIILMTTLTFGIYWCARNYRSSKHNETLNKHRANALMTFRAFVEGADSSAIKDAVLLQTSQAAFANRPTGYENETQDTQQVNPVVEILGKSLEKSE